MFNEKQREKERNKEKRDAERDRKSVGAPRNRSHVFLAIKKIMIRKKAGPSETRPGRPVKAPLLVYCINMRICIIAIYFSVLMILHHIADALWFNEKQSYHKPMLLPLNFQQPEKNLKIKLK